jgi:hypothetical protein
VRQFVARVGLAPGIERLAVAISDRFVVQQRKPMRCLGDHFLGRFIEARHAGESSVYKAL